MQLTLHQYIMAKQYQYVLLFTNISDQLCSCFLWKLTTIIVITAFYMSHSKAIEEKHDCVNIKLHIVIAIVTWKYEM